MRNGLPLRGILNGFLFHGCACFYHPPPHYFHAHFHQIQGCETNLSVNVNLNQTYLQEYEWYLDASATNTFQLPYQNFSNQLLLINPLQLFAVKQALN